MCSAEISTYFEEVIRNFWGNVQKIPSEKF